MSRISLRPATTADFEFFFALHKQSLGPYVDQVWGWIDADQRAYLQRTIDFDTTQVIVVDGEDVGRLSLDRRDGDVYIGLIEVAPNHQGRGIGARAPDAGRPCGRRRKFLCDTVTDNHDRAPAVHAKVVV